MNENDVCCMNILRDYFPCGGSGGGCLETHVTPRAASAAGSVLRMSGTQCRRILSAGPKDRPKSQARIRRAKTGTVMSSGVELIPSVAVTSAWPKGASAVKMRLGTNSAAASTAIAAGMHVLPREASAADLRVRSQASTQLLKAQSAASELQSLTQIA